MNKITLHLLILISVLIFSSCSEEEIDKSDLELVGSWVLIETMNDPGDGSGEFVLVASEKIIVFSLEGTFTSNGDLCQPSIDSEMPSSGLYFNETKIIKVSECKDSEISHNYRFSDDNLIIDFPCIENCSEKYRRID